MSDCKMIQVQSSNIEEIGYSDDSKLLVRFKGGKVYEYADVPADLFNEFRAAQSVGSFFHKNILGKFETATVEG